MYKEPDKPVTPFVTLMAYQCVFPRHDVILETTPSRLSESLPISSLPESGSSAIKFSVSFNSL